VFYTQVTDGKMNKTALCESCAQHQGITDPNGLLMSEQLMGPATSPPGSDSEVSSVIGGADECPTCQFSLEDYRKIGRLGCGDCYLAFSKEVQQRLPSLHKGLKHEGRFPAGLLEQEERRGLLESLNERLQKAISEEDFEQAASLRDELRDALKDQKEEEANS